MLLQFSVENFLSFREEAVLNLTAAEGAGDPKHPAYAEAGGERVLRCAALYGANASGKSNLVRALDAARRLAVWGAAPDAPLDVTSFRLDESLQRRPSRFTFHVALDGKKYEYSLEADSRRVTAEHLYESVGEDERLAFERSIEGPKAGIRFGPALEADTTRTQFLRFVAEGTRPNQPFLAEARQRNVGELAPFTRWLGQGLAAVGPKGNLMQNLEAQIDSDAELRRAFEHLIQTADVGIDGLTVERLPFDPINPWPTLQSLIVHQARHGSSLFPEPYFGAHVEGEASGQDHIARLKTQHPTAQGQRVAFDLSEESDGTRRFMELAPTLLADHLGDIGEGTLLIDELERSLHPLLCRFFVNAFLRAGGAAGRQLIFTTHDTNLLNRSLLPADAVWFVQKDARGASKLYSLADFKPEQLRALKGTLEEGYLQGRFGAIPFLGDPMSLGWHGPPGGPNGGANPAKAGPASAKQGAKTKSASTKRSRGTGSAQGKNATGVAASGVTSVRTARRTAKAGRP